MRYAWGYAPPLILEAAVRIRVFDALDDGPKTIAETSAVTRVTERALSAIMNALVGLEFLTRDDAGRYALTPESAAFLVSSKPVYFGGFLQHVSTQLIPGLAGADEGGADGASRSNRLINAAKDRRFSRNLWPACLP